MPRLRIIVLDQDPTSANAYNTVFWADVPVARQSFYANATATSAWKNALAADLTALRNGSVAETITRQSFVPQMTLAQIETYLQTQWTAFQAGVTSFNPWLHYGSTWDGTTWVVTTGA